MSSFIERIIEQAKGDKKSIVLPEGDDVRIQQAASIALEKGIADIVLLGDEDSVRAGGFNLEGARIIDPLNSPDLERYAEELYELRKHKGMNLDKARETLLQRVYYGTMMVKLGEVDGMVCGATYTTSDTLRPSLQIIKTAPEVKLVSSFFVMVVPNCEYGQDGAFIYSDCGLEIQPDSEKLAHIAVTAANSWRTLFGTEPYVAMLSHSTYGSAVESYERTKVTDALELAHQLDPYLKIDGEMQGDAALVPEVAASKAPGSPVAGKANVLIFPDIDAGSVAYKLTQRLAKAEAYGPITQGLAAPVNDLSRGCSAEDVVGVIAITCVQAQMR